MDSRTSPSLIEYAMLCTADRVISILKLGQARFPGLHRRGVQVGFRWQLQVGTGSSRKRSSQNSYVQLQLLGFHSEAAWCCASSMPVTRRSCDLAGWKMGLFQAMPAIGRACLNFGKVDLI